MMAVFIISNSTPLELKPHLLEDEMIRVRQEKFLSIQQPSIKVVEYMNYIA